MSINYENVSYWKEQKSEIIQKNICDNHNTFINDNFQKSPCENHNTFSKMILFRNGISWRSCDQCPVQVIKKQNK